MTKAGDKILAGAKAALAHVRGDKSFDDPSQNLIVADSAEEKV